VSRQLLETNLTDEFIIPALEELIIYVLVLGVYYPNTLADSTLIILFSEMLRISKIISSKSKKYCEG
jgi:hypothetical protein